MAVGQPPQIYPPVGQASVTSLTGTGANMLADGNAVLTNPVNPALASKNGPALSSPEYSPPVNFQQVPNNGT